MGFKKTEPKSDQRQKRNTGFIRAFKKAHPVMTDAGAVVAGVCSVLSLFLTAAAIFFPDDLKAFAEMMFDEGVAESLAVIIRHIAVQENQAFPASFSIWSITAIVFAFSSLRGNRGAKRDVETAKVSWNYFWNTFVFLATMLVLYSVNRALGVPYLFGSALTGFGLTALEVLLALGACVVVMARLRLGETWEPGVSINDVEPPLMTKGAYSHVRHPLYGGLDLMYIATALMLFGGNYIAVAIAATAIVVNCARARQEDRVLVSKYGDAWRKYASETPFIFPAFRPLAK